MELLGAKRSEMPCGCAASVCICWVGCTAGWLSRSKGWLLQAVNVLGEWCDSWCWLLLQAKGFQVFSFDPEEYELLR